MNIIKEYEGLIYSVMKYFSNYKNKEDLYQVGCLGLLYAYKNFDNTKNCKFSTYAYSYILGEMKKLVREDKSVKVNRDIINLNFRIEKVKDLLSQKYLRIPTTKEIAEFLEMDEYYVSEAMKSINCVESLDLDLNDTSLYEYVPSNDINDYDLDYALDSLTELERTLINSRYYNGYTQEETAKLLNTNQVKVSREEKKILLKLKNKLVP